MEHYPCQNRDECHLVDTTRGCFEDVHHLDYPSYTYRGKLETQHRQAHFSKIKVCRALHEAIHATGYVPTKPIPEHMSQDLYDRGSARMAAEQRRQVELGQDLLNQDREARSA